MNARITNPVSASVTKSAPPPPPPIESVTITMPYQHAITLAVVSNNVSGYPNGRRGHMDDIVRALRNAGVPGPGDADYDAARNTRKGTIDFSDGSYSSGLRY